jgi:hypothetical protein
MKIYKFKDLTDEQKHSHFLQIVLKNSIWCARPDSLNDEDEFIFTLDYDMNLRRVRLNFYLKWSLNTEPPIIFRLMYQRP